jgi:hypothetical protein
MMRAMCSMDPNCTRPEPVRTPEEQRLVKAVAADLAAASIAADHSELRRLRTPLGNLQWIEAWIPDGALRRSWGRLNGDQLADDELEWLLERYDPARAERVLRVIVGDLSDTAA